MKNAAFITFALLAFTACKKREYPPDKTQLGDVPIVFSGYFGETPLNLQVGTENYYCYSSFKQRPDSIYSYVAELKKYECSPCVNVLRIEISDVKQRLSGVSTDIDSVLRPGKRAFLPALSKACTFKFTSSSNKPVSSVQWNFGDGSTSNTQETSHEFRQAGAQTVSLTLRTPECESMITSKIHIADDGSYFGCDIQADPGTGTTVGFTPHIIGGTPPYSYKWHFGDGDTSTLDTPAHSYNYAGSYPVKLIVKDAAERTCESNYNVVAGNDRSSCTVQMSKTPTSTRVAYLDGAKVQWTDANGKIYGSDIVAQNADNYFEVIDSSPYQPNERNETARLVRVRFNMMVSD
ncbi:MAG TPA: PKD domain-containing protein, partial [Chitinophagaceae bacterium]|nr:PKD domain-containing protein [Chitinophagaceae bacterium]